MSDPAASLAAIDKANSDLLKKNYAGKAGGAFVTEVKESLLFQYNWSELLSAAPTAISLMGACHVAAASEEAAKISLGDAAPAGGFKYLRVAAAKPTLRACLVFVSDQGNKTFNIAGNNMSAIAGTSGELTSTVGDIVRATQSLPETQRNLETKLNQLRRLSDNCLKYADETSKAFDDWLLSVAEFHQASVQKHGTTSAESEANVSAQLQAKIEEDYTGQELEKADEATAVMRASLEKADKAFQKANDDVPTAWETCAMGAVNSIMQAGPSIIAQALPALIASANPMSIVSGIAGALGQVGKNGAANAPGGSEVIKGIAGAIPNKELSMKVDATPKTDPAYQAAPMLAPFINSLQAYLTQGPDNSVDWAKFKDQPSAEEDGQSTEEGTKGLTWLLTNLKMQQKNAHLGKGKPSIDLGTAFDESIKIVEVIKKEVGNQLQLSAGKTDKEEVKRWQDGITKIKETVARLETTAKTFPGTSSSTPSMTNMKFDVPKTDYSSQNAALSSATEKLAINQKALETSQANFQKAAEAAAAVQKQMTAIKTKMAGLGMQGKTLERVKEILIDCIGILVELKVQIGKLSAFFSALSTMVHLIVETKVKKFDEDVSSVAKDAVKKSMLGLNDMDIETIYSSTLQIKAYFDLLHSICSMYTKMHAEHVQPGLALVSEVSKVCQAGADIRPRREALDKFTDGAQAAIAKLVGDQQQQISDGLQDRLDNIAAQTEILHKVGVPKQSAGMVAAMKTGGEVVQDAVKENLPTKMRASLMVDASDF